MDRDLTPDSTCLTLNIYSHTEPNQKETLIYMQKRERHNLLIDFVKSNKVSTQEELRTFLTTKQIETTQATISRDIQEIPLIKKSGFYVYEPPKMGTGASQHVLAIKVVLPNLILIKTAYGWAQSIGSLIDKKGITGVAGTVAGGDTIVAVVEDQNDLNKTKNHLIDFFDAEKGMSDISLS